MQIIYNTAKPFDKLLKKQKPKAGAKYRPMYYVVEQPVDEGLLLYHTMTKAFLLLTPEEAEIYKTHPADLQQLIDLWFLVPEDHDDRLLARQIRDVAKMLEYKTDAVTSFTILTTTDCNARCFYCYELGRPRIPMSKKIAQDSATFIINHSKGKKVKLHWLGGEPLYNKQVITIITKTLQEYGIEFSSSMISNGYLFNPKTIIEANEQWHLKRVQITLDGTEKVYNRCKSYIYKNVNPYKIVISNIHQLLNNGINVAIRINIDVHNTDNISELVEELKQEFCDSTSLIIYFHVLFEDTNGSMAMRKIDYRKKIFKKIIELENQLRDYGFNNNKLTHKIKTNRCMADNDHSIVIFPQGNIGKCQHYTEKYFVGNLSNTACEWDSDIIDAFKKFKEIEACKKCFHFPDCFWLQMCEDQPHCYQEERDYFYFATKQKMINTYYSINNNIKDNNAIGK